MANLTRVPRNVAAVTETKPHMRVYHAGAELEAGMPCELQTDGSIIPMTADGVFVGVALGPAVVGEAVSVLWDGSIEGYNLSALAYGAPVYSSATAGAVADATSAGAKVIGVVLPLTDRPRTKVLYIQARPF